MRSRPFSCLGRGSYPTELAPAKPVEPTGGWERADFAAALVARVQGYSTTLGTSYADAAEKLISIAESPEKRAMYRRILFGGLDTGRHFGPAEGGHL